MDISVVIPLYNSEETIIEAVESVLNQTYLGKIELIIINDGSTDNSLKVVNSYILNNNISNIKIIDQVNGGVQKARNAGLRAATGEWIALLDSDDFWLPEKIEKQMKVLRENPHIDFLGCNRNNEETKILWRKKNSLSKINFKDLLIKMYPQTSTAIFKRSILTDIGFYDETLRYAEDADYWLRISLKKEMYFMPESLVITGQGKPSFGFSGLSANLRAMQEGNLQILYKNLKEKNISPLEYSFFRVFYLIKYTRRMLITKLRRNDI
jgi:glycosyltransferase involved in cell wall biosynthesis